MTSPTFATKAERFAYWLGQRPDDLGARRLLRLALDVCAGLGGLGWSGGFPLDKRPGVGHPEVMTTSRTPKAAQALADQFRRIKDRDGVTVHVAPHGFIERGPQTFISSRYQPGLKPYAWDGAEYKTLGEAKADL